jgi:Outer membrane protein beta-barrel domain
MKRRMVRSCLIFFGLVLTLSGFPLFAQDNYTLLELGGQFSTIRETNSNRDGENYPGFGARADWNLNRRLALEAQLDFFPERAPASFGTQGGRTLQAVFGVRAKVIQTRNFAVFGLVRPGLLHFTDALDYSSDPSMPYSTHPETHFVLNLGGGIEYYLAPRWLLRAEIAGNPFRVPNETVPNSGGVPAPGQIEDTTRLSFGVAYRPGVLKDNESETNVPGKWEFGPLFSAMILEREGTEDGVRTEPGFGGYASYQFYHVLYFDGSVLYFARDTNSAGAHDGGKILQGEFGIKGGIRRNHFGIFGKVRPGFHSYSDALSSATDTGMGSTIYTYDRSTNFVLDLGGILEFYPNEKGTLRLEAGDTHVYFGTRDVNLYGTVTPVDGGKLRHSLQFNVGYGWRF